MRKLLWINAYSFVSLAIRLAIITAAIGFVLSRNPHLIP